MEQLCLPIQYPDLPLASMELAPIVIEIYKRPFTLKGMRAEARRLGCERTHVKPLHYLIRHIATARLETTS